MFNVTLNFKKGPSFSQRINARTKGDAYKITVEFARGSGFTEAIKNHNIVDEHYTDGRVWSEKRKAWVFECDEQWDEDMQAYMTPEYH